MADDNLLARIEASLADLSSATDEQLGEYETALLEQIGAYAEDDSADALEAMSRMADAVEQIRAEAASRYEAAAERAAQREEVLARLGVNAQTEDEDEPEVTPDEDQPADQAGEQPAEEPADEPAEPTSETEQEPIAAAAEQPKRPKLSDIRARVPKAREPQPRPTEAGRTVITAAGDVEGFSAGSRLTPMEAAEALGRKLQAFMGTQSHGRALVASVRPTSWPEERILKGSDEDNIAKINAVLEGAETKSLEALTAAGGICAPVEARYDMFDIGSDVRPVRDALPRFNASRGGIRFLPSPTITDLDAGTGVWSEATDDSPGANTKAIVTINCPDITEVLVDAVTLRVQVGNFRRLFNPEQVARWMALGLINHARVAETNLLDSIAANSIDVTDGQNFGAARDLLEGAGRAAAQYRSRHRMPSDAVLQLFLPGWIKDMIRADLLRQQAGDGTYAVADAMIDGWFRAMNIAVTYYLDTETGEAQIYATQGLVADAEAALLGWQTSVVGYLFAPGTHIFLDGGQLDLGVDVRDSTLNDTNDSQSFFETFEEAARVGVESLKITWTLCPSGEGALPIDAISCVASS